MERDLTECHGFYANRSFCSPFDLWFKIAVMIDNGLSDTGMRPILQDLNRTDQNLG
jgi:hypothetical protein